MRNFHLIDKIQTEIAVINSDMTIVDANYAFQHRHKEDNTCVIGEKCFNAAYKFSEGCGYKKAGSCPVRRSFLSKERSTAIHHFWIDDHAVVEELTATPIIEKNGDVSLVIEEYRDITQLLGLKKGIIGICSYCRKIRDEDGKWLTFEAYLQKHTGAKFSHGVCETCYDELRNDFETSKCSHH